VQVLRRWRGSVHNYPRSLPGSAGEVKLAVVGLHGPVDWGQPETGTLTSVLGGEEGVQGLFLDFVGHSATCIGHFEGNHA
jgi:hypothetical protein